MAVRFVLDTHALVWYLEGHQVSLLTKDTNIVSSGLVSTVW